MIAAAMRSRRPFSFLFCFGTPASNIYSKALLEVYRSSSLTTGISGKCLFRISFINFCTISVARPSSPFGVRGHPTINLSTFEESTNFLISARISSGENVPTGLAMVCKRSVRATPIRLVPTSIPTSLEYSCKLFFCIAKFT